MANITATCSYCGRTLKAWWGQGGHGAPRLFKHNDQRTTIPHIVCRGSQKFGRLTGKRK